MSPTGVYLITVLRSLIVVGVTLGIGRVVCRLLTTIGSDRPHVRTAIWIALLTPLLTPALVIGYVYRSFSLLLIHHAYLNESLYVLIAVSRLVPIAAAIMMYAPPSPVSSRAFWCAALVRSRLSPLQRLGFWARAKALGPLTAFGVVFVSTFCEFEIASLMQIRTWSVRLFDMQAAGWSLSASLSYGLVPLAVELLVLAPLLVLLVKQHRLPALAPTKINRRVRYVAAIIYLFVALFTVTLLPVGTLSYQSVRGIGPVLKHFPAGDEILASLLFAAGAASIVFILTAIGIGARQRIGAVKLTGIILLCIPGLLGSLLLSMVVRALFQFPVLIPLRDEPIPLLVALVLLVLPPAMLLRALQSGLLDNASLYSARQLLASPCRTVRAGGRQLRWHLKDRAGYAIFSVLFLWAYFDLCAGVLLQPRSVTPAANLLYNLMHYGQSSVLSATVAVYALAPVVGLVIGLGFVGKLMVGRASRPSSAGTADPPPRSGVFRRGHVLWRTALSRGPHG